MQANPAYSASSMLIADQLQTLLHHQMLHLKLLPWTSWKSLIFGKIVPFILFSYLISPFACLSVFFLDFELSAVKFGIWFLHRRFGFLIAWARLRILLFWRHVAFSNIVSFIHPCRVSLEGISLFFLFQVWLRIVFIFSLGFQQFLIFILQELFYFSFFLLKVLFPFAVKYFQLAF